MHYYGERYQPLRVPAAGSAAGSLRACAPQPQAASGACLPLCVTKGPACAAWPGSLQPLRVLCAPPRAAALPLLRLQPCVPRATLLGRDACEAAALAARAATAATCSAQPGRPERRRVAKSLPPCAPRCPEPGTLRFPPCGIRSSASCRGERAAAARGSRRAAARAGPGGYSRPLQGGTECPQERAPPGGRVLRELQECGGAFPLQRCTKGYPLQDCVSPCLLQPLDTKPPPAAKGRPCAARGSLAHGDKLRGTGATHAAKTRGAHPCGAPHAARPHAGTGKGSGHGKKSRCAAKWFW